MTSPTKRRGVAPCGRLAIWAALLSFGLFAPNAKAVDEQRDRQREEEARQAADTASGRAGAEAGGGLQVDRDQANRLPDKEVVREFLYEYGGWVRTGVTSFDDIGRDRTFRDIDLRLWLSTEYTKAHKFYIRSQHQWINYNEGNSFGYRDADLFGPRIDQTYYELDFGHYLGNDDLELKGSIGRQFYIFGQGIAYSNVHDGGQITGKYRFNDTYQLNFKLLGTKTIKSQNDIDGTKPDSRRSRRFFYGVETGLERFHWGPFREFQPKFYWLNQRDPGREIFTKGNEDFTREFEYDSYYFGFGGRSEIDWELFGWEALKNLNFNGGIVGEFGKSDSNIPQNRQERIRAYAFIGEGEYFFRDIPTTPRMTLAYLTASGDNNTGSISGTIGGNRAGTHDRGFLGFGYVYTGLVLAPRFSNIHVFRGGLSLQPVSPRRYFESFEVGLQSFLFLKNADKGAMSDADASKRERFVGIEFDAFLNWVILSDLNLNVKIGDYLPGAAYKVREDRMYVTAALNFSF